MNYVEIEAFLAIIEKENFTEAAKSLFISQSTLSHRLFNLENRLGKRLLERQKGCKSILLTESGREFIVVAKNWQLLMQDVERIKAGRADNLSLSMGTVDTFHAFVFPPLYRLLAEKQPPLSLNLRTYNSAELYQQVDRGSLDVAFTLLNLPVKNILVQQVHREPRVVLMRQSKGVGKDTQIGIKELDYNKEVFFIGDVNFNNWYRVWKGKLGYAHMQVDTVQLLDLHMQMEGSWAVVPLCIARVWVAKGGYAWYYLDNPPPERMCYRIQPQYMSEATTRALELFDACLAEVRKRVCV